METNLKTFKIDCKVEPQFNGKGEKNTFDVSDVPFELIPTLVRQLNTALFIRGASVRFEQERALYAERSGRTMEGQMSLALRLKN